MSTASSSTVSPTGGALCFEISCGGTTGCPKTAALLLRNESAAITLQMKVIVSVLVLKFWVPAATKKGSDAQLPDCAPVRIVDGLFSALEVEKVTVVSGTRIVLAPADPLNYLLFTRIIYLTDWVQDTLGEVNSALGYLVPWKGPFIPSVMTSPVNSGVDWAQSGALTLYIYVFRKISVGLDDGLYGGEWAWGEVVSQFVDKGQPVDQRP